MTVTWPKVAVSENWSALPSGPVISPFAVIVWISPLPGSNFIPTGTSWMSPPSRSSPGW